MPTDRFWADALYPQGGAAHCKHHILLHGIQGQQEVRLPLVAPSCVNVFLCFSMTTGSCNDIQNMYIT